MAKEKETKTIEDITANLIYGNKAKNKFKK
jgi:hypothetical protein